MNFNVYPSVSMQLAHSMSHDKDSSYLTKERNPCHWCRFQQWESNKMFPVSIVNKETNDTIDNNFVFIEKNIIREGVELADEEFQAGCECASSYNCMKSGCYCLEDVDTSGKMENLSINAYHVVGRRKGCLRGLRSTEDIKKGQFVGSYVGELITAEEANWRRAQSTKSQKKDVYLFALDKFTDPNSSDERLRGEPYEIDGEYFAGPTRFINHSCEPNLRIFAVVRDLANKPFHDLCFFALKEIPRFTELTFDYAGGVRGEEKGIDRMEEGMTRCLCGSKNCRNWLW